MNRALPPGDCGRRGADPLRAPGGRGIVPRAGRLVEGTSADPCPDGEAPPRGCPGGQSGSGSSGSALDRVVALPVVALRGGDREAHLLPEGPADEPADAVRLPAGGLHNLLQVTPPHQVEDLGGLAALARSGSSPPSCSFTYRIERRSGTAVQMVADERSWRLLAMRSFSCVATRSMA
jgi:hypothetical protein